MAPEFFLHIKQNIVPSNTRRNHSLSLRLHTKAKHKPPTYTPQSHTINLHNPQLTSLKPMYNNPFKRLPYNPNPHSNTICRLCSKTGHVAKDCRWSRKFLFSSSTSSFSASSSSASTQSELEGVKYCFNCNMRNHKHGRLL